jgi:P27 family predicted phage terminase small subunit
MKACSKGVNSMARPAKVISAKTSNDIKAEKEMRQKTENKLKGKGVRITPPSYLSPNQKKLFKTIVKNLTEAGILGVLDIYVLSTAAITIDRLMTMEKQINEDEELLLDSKFMSSKDKYMKDFFRICNELCLSPQARAKISIATVNGVKEGKKNPILDALLDDD